MSPLATTIVLPIAPPLIPQSHPTKSRDDEVARLRAEVQQLEERQRCVMELIGCPSPDRLIHDIRNLMNQVQLLKLLTEDHA